MKSNDKQVRELDRGYASSLNQIDQRSWDNELQQFEDANIYQSWPYAEILSGKRKVSQLVLFRDGEVVAMVQVRLAKAPLIKAGIGYVRWGPLWRKKGKSEDPAVFRNMIRAMRNEFCCKGGLVLRINFNLVPAKTQWAEGVLDDEGFRSLGPQSRSRTILYDITPTVEELREGMKAHWRRELKVADKNNLEVLEGSSRELFAQFIHIYKEMVSRKKFKESNDIGQFQKIQEQLPEGLKMRILLAKYQGEISSGVIYSAMGDSAVYLFGATSDNGLKSRGSYRLQWDALQHLKSQGIQVYNLNGINPERNPGTYKFKNDLAGVHGSDVYFLGQFDACTSALSAWAVCTAEQLRGKYRAFRTRPKVTNHPPALNAPNELGKVERT